MSTLEREGARDSAAERTLERIDHFGLTVTDIEVSEEWYGRVLGMQRLFVEPHHGGDGSSYCVVLGGGGVMFGLDHHPTNAGQSFDAACTGLDHVCLRVPSRAALDAWTEHLDREGVEHSGVVELEAAGMHFSIVSFRDPDNIALELMSVP